MSATTATPTRAACALAIALASVAAGGCFIEQIPAYDSDDIGPVGAGPALKMLGVGGGTTCAVLEDGSVRCWGVRPRGLYPEGEVGGLLRPVRVAALTEVDEIALGGDHGCARSGAQVMCFGNNQHGQLGTGPSTVGPTTTMPTLVPDLDGVTQIVAGGSVSGAVTSDGTAWVWGVPRPFGVTASPTPVAGLTGVTALSRGGSHDCALHGGQVSCWGDNGMGQLGRGTIDTTVPTIDETPAPVVGITDAVMITTGADSCVLHATGAVSCWGAGVDAGTPPQPTPTPVAGLAGVTKIVGGGGHTCAITEDRSLLCWGSNYQGALGLGPDAPNALTPTQVPGLADIVDVAVGGTATCARRADRVVLCWGGQIPGNGTEAYSPVPVPVAW